MLTFPIRVDIDHLVYGGRRLGPQGDGLQAEQTNQRTLVDHVNISAGFDPTNDLLINSMLS